MSLNLFYVYILFRPWDGSPFYVGKGKGDRWSHHWHPKRKHNAYLRRIVEKAQRLGLEIPKIKIREHLSEAQAFEIEIAFIAAIGRGSKGPLVNLTDGGDGTSGLIKSPETCAKLSAALRGNKNSLGRIESSITIEKKRHSGIIAQSKIDHNPSRETRAKLAAKSKGNKHAKGSKRTAERLEKQSLESLANWQEPAYREMIISRIKESVNDPKVKAKRRGSLKVLWKDPAYRAKRHTLSARQKHSIAMKEFWADPVRRASIMEARRLKAEIRHQRSQDQEQQHQKIVEAPERSHSPADEPQLQT